MKLHGRTWLFGDHLNTDLMFPAGAFLVPQAERPFLVFESIRPGWSRQVEEGDLLVAGVNFGTGSGRPAAALLKELGIRGLVADSINGLFLRSCINYALPALECPGVSDVVREGDVLTVDFASGRVTTEDGAVTMEVPGLPAPLLELIAAGGLIEKLQADGYVENHLPA